MQTNVPTKSERDDGGSNPIGMIGLLFGILIYIYFLWTFIDSVIGWIF